MHVYKILMKYAVPQNLCCKGIKPQICNHGRQKRNGFKFAPDDASLAMANAIEVLCHTSRPCTGSTRALFSNHGVVPVEAWRNPVVICAFSFAMRES